MLTATTLLTLALVAQAPAAAPEAPEAPAPPASTAPAAAAVPKPASAPAPRTASAAAPSSRVDGEPTDAAAILEAVDRAARPGRDAQMDLELSVLEAEGRVAKTRKLRVWQRGDRQRMLKVLEPRRLRGVGLLVPAEGELYLYLPAFGRVRQIVGPDRGDRFLGTDFTFDDLTRTRFAPDYTPAMEAADAGGCTLRLTPKRADEQRHAALRLRVRKPDHLYTRVDFLDAGGEATRSITFDDFRKVGERTVAYAIEVVDHETGRRTRAQLSAVRFDQGLDESLFDRRYLTRPPEGP